MKKRSKKVLGKMAKGLTYTTTIRWANNSRRKFKIPEDPKCPIAVRGQSRRPVRTVDPVSESVSIVNNCGEVAGRVVLSRGKFRVITPQGSRPVKMAPSKPGGVGKHPYDMAVGRPDLVGVMPVVDLLWHCRMDFVSREMPPLNLSFADIYSANDVEQAVEFAVGACLKRWNKRLYSFVSEVLVSRYFVNAPKQVRRNRYAFTSGQGVTMFWWRHDSQKWLADYHKEWLAERRGERDLYKGVRTRLGERIKVVLK